MTDAAADASAGPVPSDRLPSTAVRRVLLIGSGGAGKTTLAARIADRTGLPIVHLDALYWHAGWVPTPTDEWLTHIEQIVAQNAWVMDGNYGGTLDVRLAACDTVVFLDLPRIVCIWRILRRWARYAGRDRPGLAPGCPERMTWEFFWWVWTYPGRRRACILERLATLPQSTRVEVLRSAADIERFLLTLSARG